MTETTLLAGTFPGMEVRPGSMGKSGPGYKVDIVDDEGKQPPLNVCKCLNALINYIENRKFV